jgi:hypothetical protein
MELTLRRGFVEGAVALQRDQFPEHAPSAPAGLDAGGESPVIVVGGGPSGLRVTQELVRRDIPVVLFNAERWRPYNRVKLTPFLAGEVQIGRVYQENAFLPKARVTQYNSHTIVEIDRDVKLVVNCRRFGLHRRRTEEGAGQTDPRPLHFPLPCLLAPAGRARPREDRVHRRIRIGAR